MGETAVRTAFAVAVLTAAVYATSSGAAHSQTSLPASPLCSEATVLAEQPAAATGSLTGKLIDCFGELLAVMRVLSIDVVESNAVTAPIRRPFFRAYDAAVERTMSLLRNDILQNASAESLADADRVIRKSVITAEISAFQLFVQTPSHSFPTTEDKAKVGKELIKSLKNLLKALKIFPPGIFKLLVDALFEAVDEAMDVFF
jgi:hypothetical protein